MIKRLLPLVFVSAVVTLNILSAIILKQAADMEQPTRLLLATILILLVFINLLRVAFWSSIHRRFPLSDSYPLTSIFFPIVLMISLLYGEQVGLNQLIGTFFITVGVAILVQGSDRKSASQDNPAKQDYD